jgi:hypothetical protein
VKNEQTCLHFIQLESAIEVAYMEHMQQQSQNAKNTKSARDL